MATAILIITIILIFVAFILMIQFPEFATEIYTVLHSLIEYMGNASGILWFFLPKELTLVVLGLVLAIEVIIRSIMIFLWIYRHVRG